MTPAKATKTRSPRIFQGTTTTRGRAYRVGPSHCVPVGDLFKAWLRWCEGNGRDSHGTQQTFGRDLLAAVPSIRKTQPRDGATRYRAYEGIGLVETST